MQVVMSGFGYSGSSAFNDLLLETGCFIELEDELRFLVDPDGLVQTHEILKHCWNPFTADIAFKRLSALLKTLGKHKSVPYYNQRHDQTVSPNYNQAVDKFLSKIDITSFEGMWLGINDAFEYQRRKLSQWSLGLVNFKHNKPIRIIDNARNFWTEAKVFVQDLFSVYQDKHLILDEGFASLSPSSFLELLEDGKMIASTRDPRDVYVEVLRKGVKFIPQNPKTFVKWYKGLREWHSQLAPSSKVLTYRFEDLILDYENSRKLIFDFIDLDIEEHRHPRTKLIPENSQKNIGKWKQSGDPEVMAYLTKELHEYTFSH